ncbi:MAG: hypothetical protein JWL71_681 [Acidobacteria bacterium]|nr:hypothetical protein [Acidobacteriota bacterium]
MHIPLDRIRPTMALAAAAAVILIVGGECNARRTRHLDEVIQRADSTALAARASAAVSNARADAEHARAELLRTRGDSLERVASASRADVEANATHYDSSRAAVDVETLAPAARRAIEDADALRLSVTPALHEDAATIAAYQGTIVHLESVIAHKDETIADLGKALDARDVQIHALEQERAPRCGWRCGAVLGVVSAALIAHAGDVASAVITLGRRHQ